MCVCAPWCLCLGVSVGDKECFEVAGVCLLSGWLFYSSACLFAWPRYSSYSTVCGFIV